MLGVLVVGSVNQDVTVFAPRLPGPGETLLGDRVVYGLGGKGANQAVAVAHCGVPVRLLASVGDDASGAELRALLGGHGVDPALLRPVPGVPSGSAHITVDAAGENCIVVVPGANAATSPERVREVGAELAGSRVVVLQSEIPAETVLAVLDVVWEAPVLLVVNLAPVIGLPEAALARIDVLVVNETEAGQLLGSPPPRTVGEARTAATRLTRTFAAAVVTLGAAGAVVAERRSDAVHIPAPVPSRVVDTTGAGDALVGVLAAGLARGAGLIAATQTAVAAATATVETVGAAPSYPAFALPF